MDPNKNIWSKGTVVETPTPDKPRAYKVQDAAEHQYECNRRFIKPAVQLVQVERRVTQSMTLDPPDNQGTRPARVRQDPDRLIAN